MPDLGFSQITASALNPGAYEILCTPFENSLCLQFPVYLNVNPSGFQSQTFWGISYQNRELDVGAKTPVSWRRTSMVVIFLLFVGGQPQGMGPS